MSFLLFIFRVPDLFQSLYALSQTKSCAQKGKIWSLKSTGSLVFSSKTHLEEQEPFVPGGSAWLGLIFWAIWWQNKAFGSHLHRRLVKPFEKMLEPTNLNFLRRWLRWEFASQKSSNVFNILSFTILLKMQRVGSANIQRRWSFIYAVCNILYFTIFC